MRPLKYLMKSLFATACCSLFLTAFASSEIQYELGVDAAGRSVRVTITVEPDGDVATFRIPAWCPGFYQIRRYEQAISDVKAVNQDGEVLTVTLADARSWSVPTGGNDRIIFSYRVAGSDPGLGFFGVSVQPTSAFVNGPAAFMYVDGRKEEACSLKMSPPKGWQIATAMDGKQGNYKSGGYDELIDHPIELGHFKKFEFLVRGVPFEAVFTSLDGRYPDLSGEVAELKALSEPALRLFGGAPFKKYLFIVHLAVGDFGGGLEHRASNVIATPNSDPISLGNLASHEYFHAWNVKQIRPKALGPFDYQNKVRTRNLWFAEGVTDYFAHLMTYESGVESETWLLNSLSYQIDELQSSRTRLQKSLDQVCWDTWEDSGFGFGDLSYYTKGLVVGLVFDAAIRDATDGKRSLDDVMRLLYERHRLPNPGYEEDGIRSAISEVAMKDLSSLYDLCVRSTKELPYGLLDRIGLKLTQPGEETIESSYYVRNGIIVDASSKLLKSGLQLGDEVLEIGGHRYSEPRFHDVCGVRHTLKVRRGGRLFKFDVAPHPESSQSYKLVRDPFADERAKRLLDGWLRKAKS